MAQDIRPRWLLRQAYDLGGIEAPQGRPRSIDLRKAISSAYYALFHCIVRATADHLLPTGTEPMRWAACRSISHESVKSVCQWVLTSGSPPSHASELIFHLRGNSDIRAIADALIQLREARFKADYDHSATFSRVEALSYVDLAFQGVLRMDDLKTIEPGDLEMFLSVIALKTPIA